MTYLLNILECLDNTEVIETLGCPLHSENLDSSEIDEAAVEVQALILSGKYPTLTKIFCRNAHESFDDRLEHLKAEVIKARQAEARDEVNQLLEVI